MNADFPGRHITPPATLARALREDKGVRLVRRAGQLELFVLRSRITAVLGRLVRHCELCYAGSAGPGAVPDGTALISSPMRRSVPAVLQVPPVADWRLLATNSRLLSRSSPAGDTTSNGCQLPARSTPGSSSKPVDPGRSGRSPEAPGRSEPGTVRFDWIGRRTAKRPAR